MSANIIFARESALFNPRLTFQNKDGSIYVLAGTQTVNIYRQNGTLLKACILTDGIAAVNNAAGTIDLSVPAATMAGLGAQYLTVESQRTDTGPIFQGSFSVRCLAAGEAAGSDIGGIVTVNFGAILVQVTQVNLATSANGTLSFDCTAAQIGVTTNLAITGVSLPVPSATAFYIDLVSPLNDATNISFDGGVTLIPLLKPDGSALAAGDFISGISYRIRVTSTDARIKGSTARW